MTYRGHIENGAVILDDPVDIPEGTTVSVAVMEDTIPAEKTLYERLSPFIGKATGLPPDLAQNHDHYLHGRPKK